MSRRLPVYTITLSLFSMLMVIGVLCSRYTRVWTSLQKHYLPAYLGGQIAGIFRDDGSYTLLQVVTKKGSRLALDNDVVPAMTESGDDAFTLTKEAIKQGALQLQLHRAYYNNAQMHAYLASWIYRDQTLIDLARPALWGGLVIFLLGVLPVTWLEQKRELRYESNRRQHSSGIDSGNKKRPLLERMLGTIKKLSRPRNKKSGHPLLAGNATTGETRPMERVTAAFPQEPPKAMTAAVRAEAPPKSNGERPEASATEQQTNQEPKTEHSVTRVSRHFFE
jgi:hypothetical protein